METSESDLDGEAYATDVAEAVTNSIFESDQCTFGEIQHEVATEACNHMNTIEPTVAKTGGTITVELHTPRANIQVELDENHPAIEDIDMGDYRGNSHDQHNDTEPSITERLEKNRSN